MASSVAAHGGSVASVPGRGEATAESAVPLAAVGHGGGREGLANDEDDDDAGAEAYEAEHVHAVYESIAPHFSATRHKPWPLVASFLAAQPPGSVGLDVGCGNGKYLSARDAEDDVVLLGCDRSAALVALAREHAPTDGGGGVSRRHSQREVLVADSLRLPFRPAAADFAVSVAVVHHLSTRPRRVDAVAELLRCVRPAGGAVLVYVWALEQASSRRGWDRGGDQDLLVPWVMKGDQGREKRRKQQQQQHQPVSPDDADAGPEKEDAAAHRTFQRYYHLYREGELEEDIIAAGGRVLRSGYERDNWWAVAENSI